MMRFADANARRRITRGAGIRYVRGRSGSRRCSAASATGAKPYMIAVALVTTETSWFHDLNGPNATQPTTNATPIENTGTPCLFVDASLLGISFSSPSAYDRRAEV